MTPTLVYAITPIAAWCTAGLLKLTVHSIRLRRLALDRVGTYGGMPSTHSTIVSATVTIVGIEEGIAHPAFAVALTVALIVTMDALGLRRHAALHAERLNQLTVGREGFEPLFETLGHRRVEIIAGIVLGFLVAMVVRALTALTIPPV